MSGGPLDAFGVYAMPGRASDSARAPIEAVEAERLGLGTIWISDRRDMKEGAVISGAMAQATSRIRLGTAVTHVGVRHPLVTAATGAAMQGLSGGRFRMGFGRSIPDKFRQMGITPPTIEAMRDNADILRRLWAGDHVDYDGPLGSFSNLALGTHYEGEPPELLLAAGGVRMLTLAGASYDGVFLEPSITAETAARFARLARGAAAAAGRDPERLRVVAVVVVAADLTPEQEASILGGRLITYLQTPASGDRIAAINGWDPAVMTAIREHPLFDGHGYDYAYADTNFTLDELAQVASDVVPEQYIRDVNATGNLQQVVTRLHEYLDAGVDELILHGSSPEQLAPVLDGLAAAHAKR